MKKYVIGGLILLVLLGCVFLDVHLLRSTSPKETTTTSPTPTPSVSSTTVPTRTKTVPQPRPKMSSTVIFTLPPVVRQSERVPGPTITVVPVLPRPTQARPTPKPAQTKQPAPKPTVTRTAAPRTVTASPSCIVNVLGIRVCLPA